MRVNILIQKKSAHMNIFMAIKKHVVRDDFSIYSLNTKSFYCDLTTGNVVDFDWLLWHM